MEKVFKIRASGASAIMTDPQSKADKEAGLLGATAKSYVLEWQRGERWSREADFGNKYTEKGHLCEEDGFDMVSISIGKMVYKNPIKLENDWATGTPDPYDKLTGELLNFDIKSSWDWTTFPYKTDKLDKTYEWQNQVYAWLAEKESWKTIYCLVNTPPKLLMQAKEKKWWALGCPDRHSDVYVQACINIEKNGIYDMERFLRQAKDNGDAFELHCKDWRYDVPASERKIEFTTIYDMAKTESLKERVIQVRNFLKNQ